MNDEENRKAIAEQEELAAQAREEQLNSDAEGRGLDEHSMDIGDGSDEGESSGKSRTPKKDKRGEELDKAADEAGKTSSESLPTGDKFRLPNTGGVTGGAEAGMGAGEAAAGTGAGAAGSAAAGAGEAATGAATAAEGAAAAGSGAATAGATVATVASVVGPVIIGILILFSVIGIVGFIVTMPQFLWNRLKELATSLWTGIQGYFIGMDEALTKKEDVIYVGQYLYDMGYDLVGMGFAESVKIAGQRDEDGNLVPTDKKHVKNQIVDIDAPFLRAYLIAENRTYLINNFTFNVKDYFGTFGFLGISKPEDWGTGLIELDDGIIGFLFPTWTRMIESI